MPHSHEEYCLCRSRDTSRFMICCDRCNVWFHGDCVKITQANAKHILHFYCPSCIERDEKLAIVYEDSNSSTVSSSTKKTPSAAVSTKRKSEVGDSVRCGQCIGCFRNEDCGKCDSCRVGGGSTCKQRICVNAELLMAKKGKKENVIKTGTKSVKRVPKKPLKSACVTGKKPSTLGPPLSTIGPLGTRSAIRAYQEFLREAHLISSDEESETIRQCIGPQCTRCARPSSKYCSDDCGFNLAKERLRVILPGRAAAYWTERPCAEILQETQLQAIRTRQEEARERLARLDEDATKLAQWLATVGSLDVKPQDEADDDDCDQQTGFCIVCGTENSVKMLARHVARCSAKYDSQSSFGSAFKAVHNPYNLFCDAYNKSNNTYCKRLRVICSEHSKPSKGDEERVCGCPLQWRQIEMAEWKLDAIDSAGFCNVNRRTCRRHYQWDRMAQALIDSERLMLLFKLDELFDEDRALRVAIASRGSVIALLTNKTEIVHHPKRENQT